MRLTAEVLDRPDVHLLLSNVPLRCRNNEQLPLSVTSDYSQHRGASAYS